MSRVDNYGVEIEAEGIRYDFNDSKNIHNGRFFELDVPETQSLSHWSAVKDGSLRNGVEFIFKGPKSYAASIKALEQIQSLFDLAAQQEKPIILSDRCSVHVHLDCRELTKNEVVNFIFCYLLIERILFNCVDIFRQKNTYCRPLNDSVFSGILMELLRVSSEEQRSIYNYITRSCDKYSALNLLPLTSYGSIEFRHHQGTTNTADIIKWIDLIRALKDTALSSDILDLLNIYDTLGYRSLLSHIFPDRPDLIDLPNSSDLVYSGVVGVREILLADKLRDINSVVRRDNKSDMFEQFLKAKGRV
jgi:hypothetical protein